ncbi:MAG TPA: hypothetical protein VKX49_25025 [Bryobacteraceae bacterium]|nr:hypothetical protein [Bryobacteraceae bacterium]
MSRHGVLFMDDEILTVGTKVEAHIHWPVKLDGNLPLKLILFGSIVRLEAGRAAFVFKRHEFRIYRQKSQAVTRHEAVLR